MAGVRICDGLLALSHPCQMQVLAAVLAAARLPAKAAMDILAWV